MTAALGDDDRAEILALLDAEIAEPPRAQGLNPLGCLVFVAASGAFLTLSVLTTRWAMASGIRSVLFGLIVVGMIAGVALIFFGGATGESRARAAATAAVDHLATLFEASTPRQNLQAAVQLLRYANYSRGPWMVATIDRDSARDRLEQAGVLPWLLEIEELLVRERRVHALFATERPY